MYSVYGMDVNKYLCTGTDVQRVRHGRKQRERGDHQRPALCEAVKPGKKFKFIFRLITEQNY